MGVGIAKGREEKLGFLERSGGFLERVFGIFIPERYQAVIPKAYVSTALVKGTNPDLYNSGAAKH